MSHETCTGLLSFVLLYTCIKNLKNMVTYYLCFVNYACVRFANEQLPEPVPLQLLNNSADFTHDIVKNNDDNDLIWCLFIISKTSFTINMFIQNISKADYAYTTFKQWYILHFGLQILQYFKMYYDTFGGLKICLLDSNRNFYPLISQVCRIFINVDNHDIYSIM